MASACAGSAEQSADPRSTPKWHPGHYAFVGTAPIQERYLPGVMRGVQRMYAWSDLEPREGEYDFAAIQSDIRRLSSMGKQLVVQLQYKSFRPGERRVPQYIVGADYGGGVYQTKTGAWNPVLWNLRVGERMDKLYFALAQVFDIDPRLEAIVLPETAPSAALIMQPQPGVERYSLPIYIDALKARMSALRKAFVQTVVIQYVNYPVAILAELTAFMRDHGIGLGGPDVYPRPLDPSQQTLEAYRYYPALSSIVPLGAAVQASNYTVAAKKRSAATARGRDSASVETTEQEEQPISIEEFIQFAKRNLRLNYLFWSVFPGVNYERVVAALSLRADRGNLISDLSIELPRMAYGKSLERS